ncbi:glycerol kinase [Fructilactobacillus lindneri DSM 20690 = JCM 11027]|uniref:Glycerol kinase n=2 Tax=Fructilactobacillus lindneri TaxID=53444 RepID=A0A0R2JPE3_9LACO|nr:glycerol kinase [Fructilactobacillus lindneri DSM 20690 = JCM 11027]
MAIDEGTTSARAILFNHQGQEIGKAQKEITQYFPHSGWVEQDANEIWNTVETIISEVLFKSEIPPYKVRSIGISNQRETTVIWDKNTGKPIYNAIVWQSKQTASIANQLKQEGYEKLIHEKTGLLIDSYFSATKIKWILDHVEGSRERAQNGELMFGTIDTWLLWKLTNGKVHATDYTNASRTMLFNINDLKWDQEILNILNIPQKLLPKVEDPSHIYGYTQDFTFMGVQIPISGIAGDQQSSLFGQLALKPGMTKNTYGTGAFIMMNLGNSVKLSKQGLLTTIAYGLNGEITYAYEGSIFAAGAAVEWLKNGIKIIDDVSESGKLAQETKTSEIVYVVPAFSGLGAPYWDQNIRGSILGLTMHTTKNQIVRATLESLGYQTKDVLETMVDETGIELKSVVVDGGVSKNNYLMQFQSDILNKTIERSQISETTALGAAYLAGLSVGYWKNITELQKNKTAGIIFNPQISQNNRNKLYDGWKMAVKATSEFKKGKSNGTS